MKKVYIELICDEDIADELMSYPHERVDVIVYSDDPSVVAEMRGDDDAGQ